MSTVLGSERLEAIKVLDSTGLDGVILEDYYICKDTSD